MLSRAALDERRVSSDAAERYLMSLPHDIRLDITLQRTSERFLPWLLPFLNDGNKINAQSWGCRQLASQSAPVRVIAGR